MKRDRRRMVKGHPIFVMSHWSSSVRTPDSQSGDRRFKSDMRCWVPWCGQWGSGLPAPRNPSGGACSKGATDLCKVRVKGSIPFVSTQAVVGIAERTDFKRLDELMTREIQGILSAKVKTVAHHREYSFTVTMCLDLSYNG